MGSLDSGGVAADEGSIRESLAPSVLVLDFFKGNVGCCLKLRLLEAVAWLLVQLE